MNELFGVSMTTIMLVMLALLGASLAVVGAIYLFNPTVARLGLRNIPRRPAQSVLIVVGLMLSTLIITAAFTVGDSLDRSITREVYDIYQRNDLEIDFQAADTVAPYVPAAIVPALEGQVAGDPNIDGFLPAIFERVPVLNPDTRLSEPRAILAGLDPERIARAGGLRDAAGRPVDLAALPLGGILINSTAADLLDAAPGSAVVLLVNGRPHTFTVAAVVRPELLTGRRPAGPNSRDTGGLVLPLAAAQDLLGKPDQINYLGVANRGGVRAGVERTPAVIDTLTPLVTTEAARQSLGLTEVGVSLDAAKQRAVAAARTAGSLFTAVFLLLGLFSIGAGMLLVFMIFVMLAAERKMEMGMARAIGLRRSHLVQSFIAEGMAYNIVAGLVGLGLGIGAAYLLVVVGTRLLVGGAFAVDLVLAPRSLIVSYALGVVLTFATVALSAWRVSKLNIVAAIRDVQEGQARRGVRSNLAWGVLGLLAGGALITTGQVSGQQLPFGAGMTALLLAAALLLRYAGVAARAAFTTAGVLIFLFWSLPESWARALFGQLTGEVEMFFISGVGMVTGSTLIMVYNARLLTRLFRGGRGLGAWLAPLSIALSALAVAALGWSLRVRAADIAQLLYMAAALLGLLFAVALFGNRAERFGPALKMAIAYPLANRFRTGMTVAMFSLIVFSITVMSTITSNFAATVTTDAARAGWDLTALVTPLNPIPDLRAALVEGGYPNPDEITAIARTTLWGRTQARAPGREAWSDYTVAAADDTFLRETSARLTARARGYATDAAVWEAVRAQPNLAVVDASAIAEPRFSTRPDAFTLAGRIKQNDPDFEPVTVPVRDPATGRETELTVIGVVDPMVSGLVAFGIITSVPSYEAGLGPARLDRAFIKLAPGVDPRAANRAVRAAVGLRGVDSLDMRAELLRQQQLGLGFNRIIQGFMALGLVVGVAALGVIAFRAVAERRQQIGMLRAIGYQRGAVALTFILESSFISVMGVLAGLIGATILSRNLFDSSAFGGTPGLVFTIPWGTVFGFLVAGVGFAVLMTWLPARQAATRPIAEALRYE